MSNETFGKIPDEAPRKKLLDLVKELGNVSEACRRLGVDRSVYYRSRRRSEGGEAPGRSPLAKPPELEKRLIALCLEYPEWGCDRLAYYLTLKGSPLSSPTAQKILMRHNLGRKAARLAAALAGKDAS
ncbi:MAG: integrase, catalytic region [Fibrobacteria bacterium]|nr:integrase, catalytic region [Fibrobacteria bacterium]